MRIAYLADHDSANGFYRAVGPMDTLAHRGHDVVALARVEPRARLAAVRDVDVVHVHRYCDPQHTQPLLREAKRHGAAVVWDDDDDMGSVPKGNPLYRKRGGLHWERRLQGMKAVLQLADLVTAPSAILAERFRGYGAREVRVLENCIPRLFLRRRDEAPRPGVTIGWVAGKEHQLDAQALGIGELLQRLLDADPAVHVTTIGLRLGLVSERYRSIDKVGVLALADHTAQFDLGIAPLQDTAFNRCKSNVKLKEYAAGATPWLASPVGPYLGLGEKQGGRLVADDRWHEAIVRLIDKPRERRRLADRARRWVEGETLEGNVERWEAALEEAVARTRATVARSGVALKQRE